jgi:hypothetical protein
MLLIVNLTARSDIFPVNAFEQIDTVLLSAGFKKEVRSVIKPGKEFSVTYDGPSIDKNHIEGLLEPVAQRNQVNFSVECEESVKFP